MVFLSAGKKHVAVFTFGGHVILRAHSYESARRRDFGAGNVIGYLVGT